jgi:NitT/TauT family transport system substrate-binding protein
MVLLIILISNTLGCQSKGTNSGGNTSTESDMRVINIADQFGLAYAPIEILKQTTILEDAFAEQGLENVTVNWQRMGNTAAIREAMVAGDLDIGFVAIPPFLIGKENGMDWQVISGVSESPVGLVASKGIESLDSLPDDALIILPQLGSVQHILLTMVAKREEGDAHFYDDRIVAMAHPDGMMAFLGQPEQMLHFTTPPYLDQELTDADSHMLLDGKTAFGGDFTFIVGVCPERFHEDLRAFQAFKSALEEATDFMATHSEDAFTILKEAYDYDEETLSKMLHQEALVYGTELKGIEQFQTHMQEMGLISEAWERSELVWEE